MKDKLFTCQRSKKFVPGQDSIVRILGRERSNTFILYGIIEVTEEELNMLGNWAEHCNEDGTPLTDELI